MIGLTKDEGKREGVGAFIPPNATRRFSSLRSKKSHRVMNNNISLRVYTIENIGIWNVMWIEESRGLYYSKIDREWTRISRTYWPVHLN